MKKILLILSAILLAGCNNKDEDIKPEYMLVNGHVCVDLGLPSGVKWATCNMGASGPHDGGDFYCWAKVKKKAYSYVDYSTDAISEISGNPEYDAAAKKWGATWRMPTNAEMNELLKCCEWTEENDGYRVTGINGNEIFLPAAGYRKGDEIYDEGKNICYATSTPYYSGYVYVLYDGYGELDISKNYPYYGRSIRPVTD